MDIRNAAKALKPCVGPDAWDTFNFADGLMSASNGEMTGQVDVDGIDGAFAVPASELSDVLNRMDKPSVTLEDGHLVLKSGRTRAKIKTLFLRPEAGLEPAPVASSFVDPKEWVKAAKLLAELALLSKDHRHWMNAILCWPDMSCSVARGGAFLACSRVPLADDEMLLNPAAVKLAASRGPFKHIEAHPGFVQWEWADGLILRANAIAGEPPAIVKQKATEWVEPSRQITFQTAEALKRVLALAGGSVTISPKGLEAKRGEKLSVTEELEQPIIEGDTALYNPAILDLIASHGNAIGGNGYPFHWKGPLLFGLAMGEHK